MEILKLVITVLFVIAALAIIVVVLLQEGKSAGLGSLNGANGNDSYWEKNKKNSLEGKFERWTKITAGLFVVFALVLMLLSSNGTVATVETIPAEGSVTTTEGNAEVQTEGEAQTENEVATPEATDAAEADQAANETEADNADAAATEGAQAQDDANANSTN